MHDQAREEAALVNIPVLLLALFAAVPSGGLIPVDESGYAKLIAANKGKVTVVSFWATWCVPCRAEIPQLVAMEKKLAGKGLKLILISADEAENESSAREFLTKASVPMPSYQKRVKNDDKFIEGLDSKWSGALPALFLYDRSGKKVKSFIGETEPATFESAITKLL